MTPHDPVPCDAAIIAGSVILQGSSSSEAQRMVEAAGIEPASEKVRTEASTRLAVSFFISPADR